MRYSNFTKNDEIEFLELTKSGLLATFIYSKNVVANGCVKRYSDNDSSIRTIAISDVIFVPVSLFTDFLGAKLQKHGDTFTLSSNEFELSVVPGDASYYLDGKKALFEKAPILKSEVLYLPAVSASRALGYFANVYYDGRLFAVGNKEVIERLESSPSLANAGGYVVFGDYDASVFTPADYKAARIRWRERLVGSEKINDLENPTVIAKINKVNENCKD